VLQLLLSLDDGLAPIQLSKLQVTDRVRVWVPPPHDLEHAPYELHAPADHGPDVAQACVLQLLLSLEDGLAPVQLS